MKRPYEHPLTEMQVFDLGTSVLNQATRGVPSTDDDITPIPE